MTALNRAPLRVLMIAPNPFFIDRGFSVRVCEEARALQRRGHRVTICAYHCGRNPPGLDVRRIPRTPWYKEDNVGASAHKLYLDALLFALVLGHSLRRRPDVIHAHLHEGALIGEVVGRLLRVPVVFDFEGSLTGELEHKAGLRPHGVAARLLRRLEGCIDRAADVVIPSAGPLAAQLPADFAVPAERVRVVFDAVDTDAFRPRPPDPALAAELNIPAGRRVVVFLGTLTPYQGVDCLLRAAARVAGEVADAHFLIMGYPNIDRYRRLADELGIGDRVTLPGRIDYERAAACLCLGEVAVSPKLSRHEANGKLYNYMACGLPTVAFEAAVNREILADAGVYARFDDADDLAAAIVALLRDRVRARSLGDAARDRAVACFSWARAAEQIEACYRGVLGR